MMPTRPNIPSVNLIDRVAAHSVSSSEPKWDRRQAIAKSHFAVAALPVRDARDAVVAVADATCRANAPNLG